MSQYDTTIEAHTSGVYYDHEGGEYCSFVDLGDDVGFTLPESDERDVYATFSEYGIESRRDISDTLQADFTAISDEAVENPTEVVNRALRMMQRNDIQELSTVPVQFGFDLGYARQKVEITEKEE